MFEAQDMLFLYVETPLHAGTGRSLGIVDLPIQRERATGYPMVQASSVKGCLRAAADPNQNPNAQVKLTDKDFLTIFGPETPDASKFAGALSTGDARLLLFPVRSLAGVFAWVTSPLALERFRRELALVESAPANFPQLTVPQPGQALVNGNLLKAGGCVVLEEYSFTPDDTQAANLQTLGDWLSQHALPQTDEYRYWRNSLPQRLCLLPEDAFRDFARYATEIQTHIKLNPGTKTVDSETGALWTAESLPMDTLLYSTVLASKSRWDETNLSAAQVIDRVRGLAITRLQMGGDETTGQGIVALKFLRS